MYEIKLYYDNQIYFSQIYLKNRYIYSRNLYNTKNITSIKSEVNNNGTQAMIWWNYKNYNQTRYLIYNISGRDQDYYSFFVPNTCINEENRTRINIFPTKNQFIFSCVMQNEFVQALMFNKDNLTPTNDSYMLYASCKNIKGLSKLYFNNKQNYYIYSCFKNCSDKRFENDTYCINKRRNTIIIVILIIIAIIILSIVLFFKCRKYIKNKYKLERDWNQSKEDEKLMNDIMKDLI